MDCSKLTINWKIGNDFTICRHNVIVNIYIYIYIYILYIYIYIWNCFVSLVKFSYWSKFHVNIITSSGVITFIRDWAEIWKSEIPPSEFCTISGDWGELRRTMWIFFLGNPCHLWSIYSYMNIYIFLCDYKFPGNFDLIVYLLSA